PHDDEHDFVPHDDGNDAQRRAQCEGADVSHEDLGRVGVEPEKAKACSSQGATEHHQLTGAGDIGDIEIGGKLDMTHEVGDYTEGTAHHHGGQDRQSVQSVRQVDGIAETDHDEVAEDDVEQPHVQRDVLEEGNKQLRLRRRSRIDVEKDDRC